MPVYDDPPADVLAACAEQGLEGIIVKRRMSKYRPGRRTPDWIKGKTEHWRHVHAPRRHEH